MSDLRNLDLTKHHLPMLLEHHTWWNVWRDSWMHDEVVRNDAAL